MELPKNPKANNKKEILKITHEAFFIDISIIRGQIWEKTKKMQFNIYMKNPAKSSHEALKSIYKNIQWQKYKKIK